MYKVKLNRYGCTKKSIEIAQELTDKGDTVLYVCDIKKQNIAMYRKQKIEPLLRKIVKPKKEKVNRILFTNGAIIYIATKQDIYDISSITCKNVIFDNVEPIKGVIERTKTFKNSKIYYIFK